MGEKICFQKTITKNINNIILEKTNNKTIFNQKKRLHTFNAFHTFMTFHTFKTKYTSKHNYINLVLLYSYPNEFCYTMLLVNEINFLDFSHLEF